MTEVKRIDIIVDHMHTSRVVRVLDDVGVEGYSVVPNVRGRGERGMQYADGVSESASNDLIITTVTPDSIEALESELRPLLKRFGGTCLVSDARWLEH